jgi:hypothetical protein
MKKISKLLSLLVFLTIPVMLFAQMKMKMPMGMAGTWQGYVTGNFCAVMDVKVCPPNGLTTEIPVLVPGKNGKLDFKHFYYFAMIPRDQQNELFNKEVKVTGSLYKNHDSIVVKSVQVQEDGTWKPFWTAPKMGM